MRTTFHIDIVLADKGGVYDSVRKSVDLSFVPAAGSNVCYEGSGVEGKTVAKVLLDIEIQTTFVTLAPDTVPDEATAETFVAEYLRNGWLRARAQAPLGEQRGTWTGQYAGVDRPRSSTGK